MMTDTVTILRKELRCMAGGGKGVFIVYALISAVWSLMLLSNAASVDPNIIAAADTGGDGSAVGPIAENRLWLIFFSVIVTANFASAALISERVSGTLEILITSGISREAVLLGKLLFITAMTAFMGGVCVILATVWAAILPGVEFSAHLNVYDVLLYLSAAVLNAAAAAYLSVRMSNPRFLHFINLFMMVGFVTMYGAAAEIISDRTGTAPHPLILSIMFMLAGVVFTLLAKREFAGERITRPVIF